MHRSLRVALIGVVAPLLSAVPVTVAFAAPTNAPDMLSGTADCGPDGMFSFVTNTGRSNVITWSPAFLTRSDGRTAQFIPASLDLTFTDPEGSQTDTVAKHTAPGPVSCEIFANPAPGLFLTGSLTGTLVWTG